MASVGMKYLNCGHPLRVRPRTGVPAWLERRRRGSLLMLVVASLVASVLVGAPEPEAAPLSGPQGTRIVDIDLAGDNSFWAVDELGVVYSGVGASGDGVGFEPIALDAEEKAVSVQSTLSGLGYWIFTDRGRVFGRGDAQQFGGLGLLSLAAPIVDAAVTASGNGYLMVARDGGVFGFGDATYVGSGAEFELSAPINSVMTVDTGGYRLGSGDGGVLSFEAPFRGSAGSLDLASPIVDAALFRSGYLLLGDDGGVFNYAGGGVFGSLGGRTLSAGAAAIAGDGSGDRYLIVQEDGVVWEFSEETTSDAGPPGLIVAQLDVAVSPIATTPVRGAIGTRDFRSSGSDLRAWSRAVPSSQDIRIPSSVDANIQPAMWVPPPAPGRPLLVVLHSWSSGYSQQWSIPFAGWAEDNGWALIAPHFRGVNKQPTATGSDLAVSDVVDAIDYAVANGADPDRVFVTGFSGGGFMTLVMAGKRPDLFAGAAAWVGIYDLPGWYNYNVVNAPWRHYIPHIQGSCGGAPVPGSAALADCLARSPMTYLDAARAAGLPVYLAGGLLDSIVPPSESARAFNQLAAPADRFTRRQIDLFSRFTLPPELQGQTDAETYFGPGDKPVVLSRQSGSVTFVLFRGAHEMMYGPALRWFAEGPPSGGFDPPPNSDVCVTPTTPSANPDAASGRGYWLLDSDGGVHAFGALQYGDLAGSDTRAMSMQSTPTGRGYWIVDYDGVVHPFGDASFQGDMSAFDLNAPIRQIIANPAGSGYWLLATDGGVFAFGDARFYGSTGSLTLAGPIVAMEPSSTGKGYWLVGEDGGIFAFGDAEFHGSAGGLVLNSPVSAMAAAPDGSGYWLYSGDGGVFTYGDIGYYGSIPSLGLCQRPTAAQLRTTNTGDGYWIAAADGRVFAYGDAFNYGDRPQLAPGVSIQDLAARRG